MEKIQKAIELLKSEFGDEWLRIAQTLGTADLCSRCGKELTSFIAFPERGEGGSNNWRGIDTTTATRSKIMIGRRSVCKSIEMHAIKIILFEFI